MRTLILIIFLSMLCSQCKNNTSPNVPTDRDMKAFFLEHQTDFEQLKEWIKEDDFRGSFPPFINQRDTLYLEKISIERRKQYDSLLQKINCSQVFCLNSENITFYYFLKGGILWSVEKNFLFKEELPYDAILCNDSIDTYEKRKGFDNLYFIKNINKQWYIEFVYDR